MQTIREIYKADNTLKKLPPAEWPKDRYLELAPKSWVGTRARLVPSELEALAGIVTVPPVLEHDPSPLLAKAAGPLRTVGRARRYRCAGGWPTRSSGRPIAGSKRWRRCAPRSAYTLWDQQGIFWSWRTNAADPARSLT